MNANTGARDRVQAAASAVGLLYAADVEALRVRILRIAGLILVVTGLLVLIGWVADSPALVSIRLQWQAMSAATALGFILLGGALLLPRGSLVSARARLPGQVAAGFAAVLSLAGLLKFATGFDTGIDFAPNIGDANNLADISPVMSAAVASGILLIAIALLLANRLRDDKLQTANGLAILAGSLGLFGTCIYLYGATTLQDNRLFAGYSAHSAILLMVAAAGVLGLQPDKGLLGVLTSGGRGGRFTRRLLPFAVALPVLAGWLPLRQVHSGNFELALAIFATVTVILLGLMMRVTGQSFDRADVLSHRADAALEHEAIRHRILFEQARDGIVILGPEQKVVEANSSFAEMIGYPTAAVFRLHPWDWIVDSGTRETVVSDWSDLAADGASFESRLRRKDGTLIDAELSCTTAGFDGQRFLFLVCRDVTQRKRSQHDLYTSEQRFRRALANIPDVVVIYDKDLRIQYANTAIRVLTGHAPEEFVGKRDEEVLAEEICEAYLPTLRKASLSRKIGAVECEVRMPGSGDRSLRVTCVPLMDREGEVREVLSIMRDLTDRLQAEQAIRASEGKFRQLIEQAPAGIIIGDPNGRVELVNGRCCELLGCTQAELLGRQCSEILAAVAGAETVERVDTPRPGKDIRFESVLTRKDGSMFPAEIAVYVLDSGAQQLTFQDITARHLQEQKIARLHRIQAVTSSINAAIVRLRDRRELLQETCRVAVEEGRFCAGWIGVIDHENGELRLTAQNGMGISCDELIGKAVELVAEGAAENAVFQQRPMFDNDIGRRPDETPLRSCASGHGAKSVVALPLIVEGETFGVIVLYADERNFFDDEEISLLRELSEDVSFGLEFIAKEERVDYLAYYDMMTGLPNRSLFFNRLSRQLQDAQRKNERTVLSVFDIDRFRMINDTYGRHEGDAVIAEVAQRLSSIVQDEDTVARISGNTFAIAITDLWDDADIAQRLEELDQAMFAAAFRLGADDVRISATTGAAVYPDHAASPEELLVNAEAALRSAKSRNVAFLPYSRDMNERVAESLRFENKVRSAVDNGELALWYQPKVCSRTGELRGLEALMRWRDPESGKMIPPDTFIPVMEHTGVILSAGRWALQQVANDCLRWQERGVSAPRIAVNVSPIQLAHQNFVGSLIEAQVVAMSAGTAIDLEITESVIMDDVDSIIPKLRTLHSVGTRIHVDDFGTGYSSLAYIAKLPIDALKIDRSFVSDLRPESDGIGIVKSIISLAKAIKLQVIAEGVETAKQVQLLQELECDELQGYYIGRPLPPEETFDVIARLGSVAS